MYIPGKSGFREEEKKIVGQNQLPAKIGHPNGCQPIKGKIEMAGIRNWLSKLPARKSVYQPNRLPAISNYQPNAGASQKLLPTKKWLQAKRGCQPKAVDIQVPVEAKSCHYPKKAASQCSCQPNMALSKKWMPSEKAASQKIMPAYSGNWIKVGGNI